ncbi:MAG: methylenetetrahydrofolate--tRNA-(uracil(54)-C(5))-methyltransferase (FADH(2)-oxidizing) TrmFO [Christensenellaceae bacterium]|jgi:methylenetetrahydrofolate--tRNA-(uracil-5-)-methyltransferase|nr:methylenetetrahydrofolate--tRNA-(uracil(54)-C(5))-methyltransferase (FADH(2)-oxidizing) TrmFO [Christensenellaceae bacterium]
MRIKIIGGGLAGCEAAYRLLKAGAAVEMYEMRPVKMTPAHTTSQLAELVCSNSLKSLDPTSAQGVLKTEMRLLDSLVLKSAETAHVPAGGALAVDRYAFSQIIENELNKFANFKLFRQEIDTIDQYTIIATGPLTSDALANRIKQFTDNENLNFFDAAAPIVEFSSIDMEHAFFGSRYNKGDADYLNCPMTKEEYLLFHNALINATCAKLKDFETPNVFEGCMPVEVLAKRGVDTLRFGPMRPVGLYDKSGNRAYAVAQLRLEDCAGLLYNIVGFQTNLTFKAQRDVFGLIPALKNAIFARYGVMHRNSYLNSPRVLTTGFAAKKDTTIFFAGQLTGVEGYMESAASGILAAINMLRILKNDSLISPPTTSIIGALSHYIMSENKNFQPMRACFGLLPFLDNVKKDVRHAEYAKRSEEAMTRFINQYSL